MECCLCLSARDHVQGKFEFYHLFLYRAAELKDRDNIPLFLGECKSSFTLVWLESTSQCNSLIGYSLKLRYCHWSDQNLRQNPVLTTRLKLNHLSDCGSFLTAFKPPGLFKTCTFSNRSTWGILKNYSSASCITSLIFIKDSKYRTTP